jgi:hypothetical protein
MVGAQPIAWCLTCVALSTFPPSPCEVFVEIILNNTWSELPTPPLACDACSQPSSAAQRNNSPNTYEREQITMWPLEDAEPGEPTVARR